MREHIEAITHLAEVLYNETKGRYTINGTSAKTLQLIIDDIQEHMDSISNEIQKAALDIAADDYDRVRAYPLTDEEW